MNSDFLNQSIEFIKGVGPARSKLLSEELNLKTIKDLVDFYPYRYIDRSRDPLVEDLQLNARVNLICSFCRIINC